MKRTLAIAVPLLATAALAAVAAFDSTNFTMLGRQWQPVPTGHVPGKDGAAGDADHHPGDDCGICHAPAAPDTALYQPVARAKVFTLTGTVFDGRFARRVVPGAELVVQDWAGNVISATANDLGNFWTAAPMTGDPALGSDPADSNTWRYKAWLVAEGGVRPMMTMPAVGGMTVPRMSCSMHHVSSGTLGGAWVAPRSTLRSYPAKGLSYRRHVFPILRSKCAPCHVPGPTEASQAAETYDYGAGLDLLTYGGSTVTVENVGGTRVIEKRGIRAVVNVAVPDASLLFAKTLEGGVHGGGAFWTPASADFRALRQWIAEGANED